MSVRTSLPRLDRALVDRGYVASRTRAQELIHSAQVRVNGTITLRPASRVAPGDQLELPDTGWVGRGAGKLLAALEAFPVEVRGRRALDAGASTGGFTQVLLRRGASHVDAVDVGHGQLAMELRQDPRVNCVEGLNLRELTLHALGPEGSPPADLVVGDLSFISLTLVLPRLVQVLHPADLILLVKPQFEVGRGRLAAGGVVTDPDLRRAALRDVVDCARGLGYERAGCLDSPVVGRHGNREFLLWIRPATREDGRRLDG